MPARPCIVAGCPYIAATGSRCPQHQRQHHRDRDHQRGGTTARGYGATHQSLRAAWAPRVAAGRTHCARCGQPIRPDQDWDLDHTNDRSGYLGPSHAACNRSTNSTVSDTAHPLTPGLAQDTITYPPGVA